MNVLTLSTLLLLPVLSMAAAAKDKAPPAKEDKSGEKKAP